MIEGIVLIVVFVGIISFINGVFGGIGVMVKLGIGTIFNSFKGLGYLVGVLICMWWILKHFFLFISTY